MSFPFLKDKRPLKDQLDINKLKPDAALLSEVDKENESLLKLWREYQAKQKALDEELAALAEEQKVPTEGDSLSAISDAVKNFFLTATKKRPAEQIEAEKEALQTWYFEYVDARLASLHPKVMNLVKVAETNAAAVEENFETAANTAEVDEVFRLICGDLEKSTNLFWSLTATVKGYQSRTILSQTARMPVRFNLEAKKLAAVQHSEIETAFLERKHAAQQ
ncbi:hypothetical protein [Enterococcus songbeiensis]|uniref:hypothetical protein n=1 Tax=Enterococcus songbeiensis TaxID=2559927 RepID=UPI0010F69B69|nr:hypothetical protein [Enterococcus songbeiensis]